MFGGTALGRTVESLRAPGTVLVDDRIGEGDTVVFLFSSGSDVNRAKQRVRAAAERAGLAVRGLDEEDVDVEGAVGIELSTTVGRRTGFLEREIEADALRRLQLFERRPVVLELHPGARVTSGYAWPLDSDVFSTRFLWQTGRVRYRVPLDDLFVAFATLVAIAVVPFAVLRTYTRWIERKRLDAAERLHRLQRALLLASIALGLGAPLAALPTRLAFVPSLVFAEAVPALTRWHVVDLVVTLAFLLLLAGIATASAGLALLPAYRRLREIAPNRRETVRKLALGLVPLAIPLLWFTLVVLLPEPVHENGALQLAVALLLLAVVVAVVSPLALRIAFDTYRAPAPVRERLLAFCRRQGFRVGDVRAMRHRWEKTANAAIVGVVPRLRYILVSDYLLDTFPDDELEAVIAHEIGHGKKHHVLLKVVTTLVVTTAVLTALLAALDSFDRDDPLSLVAIPLVLTISVIAVHGLLGLVLERKADEYAAGVVGVDATVRALERLAAVNALKRRTRFGWNVLVEHPAIEQRIAHLRRSSAEGTVA